MIRINKISQSRFQQRGITLTETVVIALCLATLVPLLLAAIPELDRPNREAMCAYRLGRIGSAMLQYSFENELYLPGSPGTSGAQLLLDYPLNTDPEDINMPTDVTQTWDWAGPLAVYFDMDLDPNRAKRMDQLSKGPFWCPSNNYVADPYPYPSEQWRAARMVSYNSFRDMLYFGDDVLPDPPVEYCARYSNGSNIVIPNDYRPRINQVGDPSEKAFLADGSRYTIPYASSVYLDYEIDYKASYGGAFATGSPTLQEDYLHSHLIDPPARDISYRHKHGETVGINVTHFDGHVEWVSEPKTRHPDRWYPTGTLVPPNAMNTPTRTNVGRDAFTGPGYTYPVN